MPYRRRPAFSELGKLLNMSNGEWEAELIARRVETMMYPHLDFSFATMCRLIWLTLRGKPLPKEIPL